MLRRWMLSLLVITLLVTTTSVMGKTYEGKTQSISQNEHISNTSYLKMDSVNLGSTNTNLAREEFTASLGNSMDGIGITTEETYRDWNYWFPRTFTHLQNPVPTFEDGGFDLFTTGYSTSIFDDLSDIYSKDGIYNAAGVNEPIIDEKLRSYRTTTDTNHRTQLGYELQTLYYEMRAFIPIIHTADTVVYHEGLNIDRNWLISMMTDGKFGMGWQQISHNTDDTIIIDNPFFMEDILPFFSNQFTDRFIQDAIFPGLFNIKYHNSNDMIIPVLAAGDATWVGNSLQVDINPNANFSNGNEVEAWDVVNSYRYYLSINTNQNFNLENYFSDVTDISLVDDNTIQFDFDGTYNDVYSILDLGIMDDEVILNYTSGTQPIYTDGTTSDLGTAISNPETTFKANQENYAIGAGPYTLNGTVSTSNVNLVATPNYWNGEVGASSVSIVQNLANKETKLVSGDLHLVLPFYNYNSDTFLSNEIVTELVPSYGVQYLMINLNHPIFGTGLATPMGMEDPSQASDAAQKARTALSYLIDYEYIRDTIYQGNGNISSNMWSPYARDYDSSLPAPEYNPEKALNLFNDIGIFYPEDYPTLSNLMAPTNITAGETFEITIEYSIGSGDVSDAFLYVNSSNGQNSELMGYNDTHLLGEISLSVGGEKATLWVELENSLGAKTTSESVVIDVIPVVISEGFILANNFILSLIAGLFILQVVIRSKSN